MTRLPVFLSLAFAGILAVAWVWEQALTRVTGG